jgi:hypothetical protein
MIEQLKTALIQGIEADSTTSIKLAGKAEAYRDVLKVIKELEDQESAAKGQALEKQTVYSKEAPATPQPDTTD